MTSLIPPCYCISLLFLYFGLFLLYLYSKLITEVLGLFGFCFALALFFFLEDPVRKLHGTSSLHTGTNQDGTTEGAHKITDQISYKKKNPNSLMFPYFQNVNESHNEK